MKTALIILVAIIYLIGIITVKTLDKILPSRLRESSSHYPVLIVMWILTPVLLVMFLGYKLRSTIIN